jgi:LPXTG-motif cell wall-anchored protein
MRKFIAAAAIATVAFAGSAGIAGATKPNPEHKVTICHATPPDTAANGYVEITVDVASVGYQNSGHQDQHAADIIPPYSYDSFTYAGKGDQSILANDCKVATPPVCEDSRVSDTNEDDQCPPPVTTTTTLPPPGCEEGDVTKCPPVDPPMPTCVDPGSDCPQNQPPTCETDKTLCVGPEAPPSEQPTEISTAAVVQKKALATTGADDILWAALGAAMLALGTLLVRRTSRKRLA